MSHNMSRKNHQTTLTRASLQDAAQSAGLTGFIESLPLLWPLRYE